jgi:hypothetical protein
MPVLGSVVTARQKITINLMIAQEKFVILGTRAARLQGAASAANAFSF